MSLLARVARNRRTRARSTRAPNRVVVRDAAENASDDAATAIKAPARRLYVTDIANLSIVTGANGSFWRAVAATGTTRPALG